ncbi:MAG: molybdopterin molybdotransferase MoeA [Myxococcota bacterium]|nr:molybdopterin molybdotransferase MoeA [Myxococcota bacterium]
MISFDEACARILSDVSPLASERLPLADIAGRVLAEDVVARASLPPFDHSAMDGYAVNTADLGGAGPFRLRLAGESRAGFEAPLLLAAAACRILTGAPIPEGADAVIMQEDVVHEGDAIRFQTRPRAGQHVRRAGEDMPVAAVAIGARTRLTPGALALAAMLDRGELVVARRPRVTILCTGDELRPVGGGAAGVSIPESNSAALGALARQAGASVRVAPIASDQVESTVRAVEEALDGADVLLTVGGVSVGDYDVVRPALERAGVSLDFWRVAIKPGKPLAVGRSKTARVLGLPGNPASALVTFAMFGMPLLRAMQGDRHPTPLRLPVRLEATRKRSPDRLELLRAVLRVEGDAMIARPHDNQSSGAATSLAQSDGVALIPPGEAALPAGAPVDFVRWSDT